MKELANLKGMKELNQIQQKSIVGGLFLCDGRMQHEPCDVDNEDNGDDANQ